MCGIVGFIGKGNVQEALLRGLERLEYRGYDSAGIFLLNQPEEGYLVKRAGRIAELRAAVDFDVPAKLGIGHTRWATHGEASALNAHPHLYPDGRFVLVHNGVIENYKALKEDYLTGQDLQSQTDTEIVVALIAKFASQNRLSAKEAFTKTLSLLKGSYAIALVDQEDPDTLYAAKNKSPMLIGCGEDFNVVASDAMATIQLTDTYLEIKDQEIVTLTASEINIETLDGQSVDRDSFIAELDADDLNKGAYPFYMLKEIDEQPAVLRRLVQTYAGEDGQFEIDPDLLHAIQVSDGIHIVACGTSYNAGCVGGRLFEKLVGIPSQVHLASEFAYHQPLLEDKPFFIFLTQSGETADSRQALVKVNEAGYPSLTITNVKGSTLSREATYTLLLHAGPEIAVASTKAYTAQIAVMAILCDALAHWDYGFDMKHELGMIASVIESILAEKDKIKAWVDENLLSTRNAFYIGRYLDYYLAQEAALKLKEISYVQTEAFASGELKHGTIALIEEGTPVLALISDPDTAGHTRGNLEEVKARGANTAVIVCQDLAHQDDDFVISNLQTDLSPLALVVVTQLIAYYTALGRGLDVDKPRNLAKSVTVE